MVERGVEVKVGVRVGRANGVSGFNVAVVSSVLMANRSGVFVVFINVTVGSGEFVGAGVGVFKKERSSGMAEHPAITMARIMNTVFFTIGFLKRFTWTILSIVSRLMGFYPMF